MFSLFNNIPPVVKNLLFLNIVVYVAANLFSELHLYEHLSLYNFENDKFRPVQLITYMFMHAEFDSKIGVFHILFNMIGLVFLGQQLERIWGAKRFFFYYFACGIGAALIYFGVNYIELQLASESVNENILAIIKNGNFLGYEVQSNLPVFEYGNNRVLINRDDELTVFHAIHTPLVGASGAIFGLLIGFGMFFPNIPIYIMFIPIPIKAKYLVFGYAVYELFQEINQTPGDNVAHLAHLGGLLVGLTIILYWRYRAKRH